MSTVDAKKRCVRSCAKVEACESFGPGQTWQLRPVKKLHLPMAPTSTNFCCTSEPKTWHYGSPRFCPTSLQRLFRERVSGIPLRHNLPLSVCSFCSKLGVPVLVDGGARYSPAENSRWKSKACIVGHMVIDLCLWNMFSTITLASHASSTPIVPKSWMPRKKVWLSSLPVPSTRRNSRDLKQFCML